MSWSACPIQKSDVECADYRVRVNGTEVPLDTARVSAFPFNRRWPGHQRPMDQTEPVNFLSMSASEPLLFEVDLPEMAEKAVIRFAPGAYDTDKLIWDSRQYNVSPYCCDDLSIYRRTSRPEDRRRSP